MFFAVFCVCAILTAGWLTKSVRADRFGQSVIEQMNRQRDESDTQLFTGNSRSPNA